VNVGGRRLRIAPKGRKTKGDGDPPGLHEQIKGIRSEPKSHRDDDLPKDESSEANIATKPANVPRSLGPKGHSIGKEQVELAPKAVMSCKGGLDRKLLFALGIFL
jgi:hypothetical protein